MSKEKEETKIVGQCKSSVSLVEALELLGGFENGLVNKETGVIMFNQIWFFNQIEKIKQVLLKAQQPKQYLKWDDLEFTKERQTMNVKLNGNIYTLEYFKVFSEFVQIWIDKNFPIILANRKQFFNDLHLERVE